MKKTNQIIFRNRKDFSIPINGLFHIKIAKPALTQRYILAYLCMLISFYSFNAFSATFRPDSTYSKWIINSRMGDFRNKTTTVAFKTPTTSRTVTWDYVPGLVAKGIIKAYEQYKTDPKVQYYFTGIQDYADNITMTLGTSNIDDLNAGKMFFELHRLALEKGQTTKAATYKTKATTCRNTLKNNHYRIGGSQSTVKTNIGKNGFWHKASYVDEMWLDGLYMGPALYAEWQGNFGAELGESDNTASWNDIALQFDTIFSHTWNPVKKLNYHAWSAKPSNDTYWANQTTGTSAEFWGRGMGWFFAALVDVLEYMPENHPARVRLVNYTNKVADGLKARQDAASGCWYQLLQYNNTKTSTCGINNYLESSASAMFTYAFFKGVRLGILDAGIYLPVANKAYVGIINKFVVEESNGKIKLISSCQSAGLDNTSRKGDANYYLCGSDVTINNNTEGKVLGPFIMASLEYEKTKMCTTPAIYSVSGTTSICNGTSATVTLNGSQSGISYQLYNGTTITGETITGTGSPISWPVNTPGTYTVQTIAANGYCKTTMSNSATITITPSTTITAESLNSATYMQNSQPSPLSVSASGNNLTYQWYVNNIAANNSGSSVGSMNGGQTNSYMPSTGNTGTNYYYCIISGTCGSVTSNISGAISIIPPVPLITISSGLNPATGIKNTAISPVVFTYSNVADVNNIKTEWFTDNTYSIQTTAPSGLGFTLNSANKTITLGGTCTVAGTFFYKTGINENGGNSIQASISISEPAPAITLSTANSTQSLKAGETISNIVYELSNVTGATVTGLPNGISGTYNNGQFTVSGTVTQGTTAAAYSFVITALPLPGYIGTSPTVKGTITVIPSTIKILYLTAGTTPHANDTKLYPMLNANTNYSLTVKQAASVAPSASIYSTYDLIIINEAISSTNAEIIALNKVDKPILSLKSFVYNSGSNRWNWGVADNGKANNGTVSVSESSHPVFNGITLSNGSLNLLTSAAKKGIQPVDLTNIGGFTIAKAPKNASPYTPAVAIHDVPANVRGVANSKFLLIGICNDSYSKMTNEALALIRNAIDYLVKGTQYQLPTRIISDFDNNENIVAKVEEDISDIVINSSERKIVVSSKEIKQSGTVVNIYNCSGQVIASKPLMNGTVTFDNNFQKGFYIVVLDNISRKILINAN